MSFDLLLKGGVLPDGTQTDIAISNDRIAAVEAGISGEAGEIIDVSGHLVSPPFVDPHFHLDATLSYGNPRINASGTLLEGIALWSELKPIQTVEEIEERAVDYCDWAASMGLLAIRTHVDTSDEDGMKGVEALLSVRDKVKDYFMLTYGEGKIYDESAIMNNLSPALRTEILRFTSKDLYTKVPLFVHASA